MKFLAVLKKMLFQIKSIKRIMKRDTVKREKITEKSVPNILRDTRQSWEVYIKRPDAIPRIRK